MKILLFVLPKYLNHPKTYRTHNRQKICFPGSHFMKILLSGLELLHMYRYAQHSLMSYHSQRVKNTPYLNAAFILLCTWHILIYCWGWREEWKVIYSLCKVCTSSFHIKVFVQALYVTPVMQCRHENVHYHPFGTKVKKWGEPYLTTPYALTVCTRTAL